VTVGSGKDAKLALMECPQPKCQKCPILDKSAYIKNKLTLAIRSHIQKYYAGWIICEDPGCSGRTRRVPLAFQRAFPVCSTCFKATMYREYTDSQLYTQLLFLQNLFSLSKFNDAYPKAVEQWRLSNSHFVDEVLTRYNDLFNTAKKTMLTNKYCMVSLNKVFEGLFPITVEDRFKKP
jgi:DNA polymerase alpha subunit A